jgi:hypothetical protein
MGFGRYNCNGIPFMADIDTSFRDNFGLGKALVISIMVILFGLLLVLFDSLGYLPIR